MSEALFEILARAGMTNEESVERRLRALSPSKVKRLDDELYEAVPSIKDSQAQSQVASFDFWPNSDLAAYLGGCEEAECRVRRIDRLARFAIMWADSVFVPSYFGIDHSDVDRLRNWLGGGIKIMLRAEPCIRAGIIRIAGDSYHVCPTCQLEVEPGMDRLRLELTKAEEHVKAAYRREIAATFETNHGRLYCTTVTGPEDIIPHGLFAFTKVPPDAPPSWLPRRVRERAALGEDLHYVFKGRSLNEVFDHILHPIVEDVVSQRLSSNVVGSKYLTNRPIDKLFLDAINENDEFSNWNTILSQYLEYEMPMLEGVPLVDLIEFRAKDYDAFKVYRDTIKKVIREYIAKRPALTGHEAREIYEDFIRPELNRMNRKLGAIQERLTNKFRRDVAVSLGVVALGLSSSLLAPELAITAAGGSPFLASAAKQMLERAGASEELAGEDLYFLWKMVAKN